MQSKEQMIESLHASICKVVFTKTNGDERIMYCTLNNGMIPASEEKENKREKKENPDVQPVYDVVAQGWRSFRWDNVKNFSLGSMA